MFRCQPIVRNKNWRAEVMGEHGRVTMADLAMKGLAATPPRLSDCSKVPHLTSSGTAQRTTMFLGPAIPDQRSEGFNGTLFTDFFGAANDRF
jgi:hypothetical protein